jgi:hypothetical protein
VRRPAPKLRQRRAIIAFFVAGSLYKKELLPCWV